MPNTAVSTPSGHGPSSGVPSTSWRAGSGIRSERPLSARSGAIILVFSPKNSMGLTSVPVAAEQAEEQQQHVEDVQEDARRDRYGILHFGALEPPEVEHRVGAEDHEPGDGVDDVAARDRDEQ